MLLIFGVHHKAGTHLIQILLQSLFSGPRRPPVYTFTKLQRHNWTHFQSVTNDSRCSSSCVLFYKCLDAQTVDMIQWQALPYKMVHIVREPVSLVVSGYLYHQHSHDTQLVPGVGPDVYWNMTFLEGLRREAEVRKQERIKNASRVIITQARR